MDSAEYGVIGAGLVGASIARSLACRGREVIVVDQHEPAGPRGSSHGSARILRITYPETFYSDMALRARRLFDDLAAETGHQLITATGTLDHGDVRQPERLAEVLTDSGVDHELVGAEAAMERWPQFRFDGPVLFHRDAGVIDAQAAVAASLESALAHGAQLRTQWQVDNGSRTRGGPAAGANLTLTSATGEQLAARHVIVAAGGWLPGLCARLPICDRAQSALNRVTVRQEQVYHFPIAAGMPADWPTFIHKDAAMQAYGLPGGRDSAYTDATGATRLGIKLAEFNGGQVIGDAEEQTGRLDETGQARMIDFVSDRIPGLVAESYAEATCLFTSTPDQDFIIDTAEDITIVSACSGHGAKLAPATGELVAAALVEGTALPERFAFVRD